LVGTGLIVYLENVVGGKIEYWRLIEGLIFVAVIVFLPGGLLGSFGPRGRAWLQRALRITPETIEASSNVR
jgi:branched-chain amino acid transport system permease protein